MPGFANFHIGRGASDSVARDGIVFKFASPVKVSYFWNGDPCVPVGTTVTGIVPDWDGTRNGAMLNPTHSDPGSGSQGHRADVGEYLAGARQTFPVTLAAGDRLVACIGKSGAISGGGGGHGNDIVAVLTCLSFEAQPDMFRPPYSTTSETVYTFDDFNLNLLPSITNPVGYTIPSYVHSRIEGSTSSIWQSRSDNAWTVRSSEAMLAPRYYMKKTYGANYYLTPSAQRPNYARDFCREVGTMSIKSMISHSEQVVSAYKMIQQGIDCEGELQSVEEAWCANGFLGFGNKWPILYKKILAGENEADIPFYCTNTGFTSQKKFQEDNYTHLLSGKARWGARNGQLASETYAGSNHTVLPSAEGDMDQYEMNYEYIVNGLNPGDEYRLAADYEIIWGPSGLVLHALSARLMNSEWLTQDTQFFAYSDRWGDMTLPTEIETWRTSSSLLGGDDFITGEFKKDANVYGGTGSGWATKIWEQNR